VGYDSSTFENFLYHSSSSANENKIERIAKTTNICVVRVAIRLLLFKIRKTNVFIVDSHHLYSL
jgi:hypothetical protein